MLTVIKPSEIEVISLFEIKAHLRLDHAYEDEYLCTLIQAATNFVEEYTGRSLINRTYKLIWNRPDSDEPLQSITLLKPPLVELISIHRLIGSLKSNPIKRFYLDTNQIIPFILCSADYPVIEVVYRCGYGELPKHIPPMLRQAVMIATTELYENRQNVLLTENGVLQALLAPYKILRMP